MHSNKYNLPLKKPAEQAQPKQLSEKTAKKVADIVSLMLNEKNKR